MNSVPMLINHRLPPGLINLETLLRILNSVSSKPITKNSKLTLAVPTIHLSLDYQIPLVKRAIQQNRIAMEFHIPLNNIDQVFNLYSAVPILYHRLQPGDSLSGTCLPAAAK